MRAVLRHELNLSFHGMAAYVFGAFLLEMVGIGAMMYNINRSIANFEYALASFCIGFVFLVPILTMRIIAEEKKQKTDQLLYSLPITTTDIVLGKYFSMVLGFLIPMILVAVYPFVFSQFGDVYLQTAYGALFAFILMGMALISIGMFLSSLTESQGMAAGICTVVMLFCYYSASLADYISSTAFSYVVLILFILAIAQLVRWLTKSDYIGIVVVAICLIALGITLLCITSASSYFSCFFAYSLWRKRGITDENEVFCQRQTQTVFQPESGSIKNTHSKGWQLQLYHEPGCPCDSHCSQCVG